MILDAGEIVLHQTSKILLIELTSQWTEETIHKDVYIKQDNIN